MDGDEDQQSPAQSLLEPAPITGDRVMILVVPPQGNYVVGYYGSSSERFRDGQTGTQSVTITAATSAFSTVTFATPFDVAPTVVAQVVTPGGAAIGSTVLITAVSATDFTLRVNLAAAATITLSVHWHAIPATQ
jgi:hypothetical protein